MNKRRHISILSKSQHLKWRRASLVVGVVAAVGIVVLLVSEAAGTPTAFETESGSIGGPAAVVQNTPASNGQAVKFGPVVAAGCNPTVSALLVPSCGAWLGAWSNDYGASGLRGQTEEHEARIGRQVSFVHSYHPVGSNTLSTDDKYFVNRANTYLLTNWKPTSTWALAGGGNASVNTAIDTFANSIKTVAPKRIILVLFHEPDNDVSSGAPSCASNIYVGSSGTPAEYRAMWANVRARFDAAGVTNVVWAMNYMGFSKWDCMTKDLWPGNNLVDWVMYNPYPSGSETWNTGVGRFYNWMNVNSDATHAFSSKPYGLGEWGAWHTNQADVYKFYDDGKAAIAQNTFPNLKLYTIFDAIGVDDSRVNFNDASVVDSQEQVKYNNFVTSSGFIE